MEEGKKKHRWNIFFMYKLSRMNMEKRVFPSYKGAGGQLSADYSTQMQVWKKVWSSFSEMRVWQK